MTSTPVINPVAIVDDDPSVRRALRRLIHSEGYAVQTFASAGEFLDALPQGRPGCLVLDVRMDGMSGFGLQEHLVAERIDLPVIFITAHDDVVTRTRIERSGAAGHLRKPIDEGPLLEAIRNAIGQDGSRRP